MDHRKLDALVAEKVMGLRLVNNPSLCHTFRDNEYFNGADEVKHYSTDIADAWEVVNRLSSHIFGLQRGYEFCTATFSNSNIYWEYKNKSAPLAICVAALAVKGVAVSEWE